jgi:hypothetical protein
VITIITCKGKDLINKRERRGVMKKGFGQHYKNFTGTGIVLSVSLFLMASLFILPGKVMVDEGWGPGQDKWKFELGGYFPAISSEMKVDI